MKRIHRIAILICRRIILVAHGLSRETVEKYFTALRGRESSRGGDPRRRHDVNGIHQGLSPFDEL